MHPSRASTASVRAALPPPPVRSGSVHGDGEYVDGDVHVNTCESHASLARRWLSPHRGISKDRLTPYLRAFQLRREVFRKPGKEALKTILETAL
jgi:transposase-like protein